MGSTHMCLKQMLIYTKITAKDPVVLNLVSWFNWENTLKESLTNPSAIIYDYTWPQVL